MNMILLFISLFVHVIICKPLLHGGKILSFVDKSKRFVPIQTQNKLAVSSQISDNNNIDASELITKNISILANDYANNIITETKVKKLITSNTINNRNNDLKTRVIHFPHNEIDSDETTPGDTGNTDARLLTFPRIKIPRKMLLKNKNVNENYLIKTQNLKTFHKLRHKSKFVNNVKEYQPKVDASNHLASYDESKNNSMLSENEKLRDGREDVVESSSSDPSQAIHFKNKDEDKNLDKKLYFVSNLLKEIAGLESNSTDEETITSFIDDQVSSHASTQDNASSSTIHNNSYPTEKSQIGENADKLLRAKIGMQLTSLRNSRISNPSYLYCPDDCYTRDKSGDCLPDLNCLSNLIKR